MYTCEYADSMMFRQEISREGSARFREAGIPMDYIFLVRRKSKVSLVKQRRTGKCPVK